MRRLNAATGEGGLPSRVMGLVPEHMSYRHVMPPRRRVDRAERSLVCLIQSLEGRRLVIELRNDVIIKARLDSADEFMNMMLSDATVQTLEGIKNSYEFMYLKGRNVRYVHLPKHVDPAAVIDAQRQKIVEARLGQLRDRLRNPLSKLAKDGAGELRAQHGSSADHAVEQAALEEEAVEHGVPRQQPLLSQQQQQQQQQQGGLPHEQSAWHAGGAGSQGAAAFPQGADQEYEQHGGQHKGSSHDGDLGETSAVHRTQGQLSTLEQAESNVRGESNMRGESQAGLADTGDEEGLDADAEEALREMEEELDDEDDFDLAGGVSSDFD